MCSSCDQCAGLDVRVRVALRRALSGDIVSRRSALKCTVLYPVINLVVAYRTARSNPKPRRCNTLHGGSSHEAVKILSTLGSRNAYSGREHCTGNSNPKIPDCSFNKNASCSIAILSLSLFPSCTSSGAEGLYIRLLTRSKP